MSQTRQRIRFLRTTDGVQLAWAEAGAGPPLVKAANWITHLEFEWESPAWRHWMRFFSDHFRFVRYDERGWGKENPAFRQLFTSRFLPEGTQEQVSWFNELCRKTTSPEMAARLMEARANINVTDLLGQVRAPTLVIHAREDNVVPVSAGRF